MAQVIEKVVVTNMNVAGGRFDITYYILGTDGDPSGAEVLIDAGFSDIDTPTKVGDLLIGNFPDIDLPTT